MVLNARSPVTNYHGAMNTLIFWKHQVPKRLVQAMNHMGFCASHPFQLRAVLSMGRDSVRLARLAAADPGKLKLVIYDNFNWREQVWEASATHGSKQHDQVSALLVILNTPDNLSSTSAKHLASVERFAERAGRRHSMSPEQSLQEISPSHNDHAAFRNAAIIHVATILAGDVSAFRKFAGRIPAIHDPSAITPHVTERHFLPTFDGEQGSTRGNMEVIRHYFVDVLKLPTETFESTMHFILGDRLTTVRDRAAQDQRTVDRSPHAIDRLSNFALTSGLMHQCMNQIHNIVRNSWGGAAKDDVSLITMRDILPNRGNLNTRKIDFYAWLRFLDVTLHALVTTAVTTHLGCESADRISRSAFSFDFDHFWSLCTTVVDHFVLPSPEYLEMDGTKTLKGSTVSGHAVLLLHDLMTLREMRDAIKHGHPQRILRMLQFWTPMYYGGGGYNYAHECMELIHNIKHDWPEDTASVLLAGMLVNTTGCADGFLEGDLDNEHLNKMIKSRVHGPGTSPKLLEKQTPAICHIQQLTDQLFSELQVDRVYQRHSHVRQMTDVEMLTSHLNRAKIFRFDRDVHSDHTVVDLLSSGFRRLAGSDGGHMKHLQRHKLRFRDRGAVSSAAEVNSASDGVQGWDTLGTVEWIIDTEAGDPMTEQELDELIVEEYI